MTEPRLASPKPCLKAPHLKVQLGLRDPIWGMQSTLIPHPDVARAAGVHMMGCTADGNSTDSFTMLECADLPEVTWGLPPDHHFIWNGRLEKGQGRGWGIHEDSLPLSCGQISHHHPPHSRAWLKFPKAISWISDPGSQRPYWTGWWDKKGSPTQ
jgi:hypothetical protein